MTALRAVLPSVVMLVLVVLAIFPWGLPADTRFVLPLLPLSGILAMNLRRSHAVPEWMAFACGLLLDALSGQPLGYWALVYLSAYAIAGVLHPYRGRGIAAGWALGLAALSAIAAVQWLVMSLYTLGAADWTPLLRAAALAVLAFPVLDLLLAPFAARPRQLASGYLVRGG